MKAYHDLLKAILANGVQKPDRTGTGTISLFGPQMEFDLSKGFPLVTTKQMFTKGIIAELLWFLEGSTDERRLAEIQYGKPREELIGKQTIWTANADAQGKNLGYTNTDLIKELGPIYGANWRTYGEFLEQTYLVKKKKSKDAVWSLRDYQDKLSAKESTNKKVGTIRENKFGSKYLVVDYEKESMTYTIQFLDTHSVYTKVNRKSVDSGTIQDGFKASLYGIGKLGYYKGKQESDVNKRLRRTWENMISRCYNPKDKSYTRNQKDGIIVCRRWHVLSNFIEDMKKTPGYRQFKENKETIVLDKDYYGKNIYHPETTVLVPMRHNKKYRDDSTGYVHNYNGEFRYFCSSQDVADYLNVPQNLILNDKISSVSKVNSDYVVRFKLPVDQISEVIESIKANPDSRRHIVTSWNPETLNHVALPSCHTMFQFYVSNGKLDCKLYQRSADTFLGVPYNIASYALLTMMVAKVCGLNPGRFIHTFGDAHIYLNHVSQVNEQLTRDTEYHQLPIMKFKKDSYESIDDFTMDDFYLINYNSYPAIKAEMAV